jgi:drug/metabolite transporter (DMT)-like permease
MNHTPPATTPADDFAYTLLGILSALTVGIMFAAYAYALHTWPAQTLLWSAPVFAALFIIKHPLATLALLAGAD